MMVFWDEFARIALWACFAMFCTGAFCALVFLVQFLWTQRANGRANRRRF